MTGAGLPQADQAGDDDGADITSSAPTQSRVLYLENKDFNNAIDERNENCVIDDAQYLPSEVLYAVDYEAYVNALHLFRQEQDAAFTNLVCNEFPTFVANPYYRALKGFENHVQRLHLLRDVWELLIYTLYALVLGDFCSIGVPLQPHLITNKKLFSDKLNDKLEIIEILLKVAEQLRLDLATHALIDSVCVGRIRELNRVRNGFSHEAAKSEDQARQLYAQFYGEVFSVLRSVSGLRDYHFLRYVDQASILEMRCEIFQGHFSTKTIETFDIRPDVLTSWSPYLNRQVLLIMHDDRLFTAAPFLHALDSDTGQYSRLGYYKKKSRDQFVFELVGESRTVEVAGTVFTRQLEKIEHLLSCGTPGSSVQP